MIQDRDFVKVIWQIHTPGADGVSLTADVTLPNQYIIGLRTVFAPTLAQAERMVQEYIDLIQMVLEGFVLSIYPKFPGVPPKLKEKPCLEKYQLELF
jgi:hypothetical protein